MKIQKILAILLCLTILFSVASLFGGVYAEETKENETEETVDGDTQDGVSAKFKPKEFVKNLKYMGIGMLGIFIVIGIIILSTMLVNRLFSGRPKKQD